LQDDGVCKDDLPQPVYRQTRTALGDTGERLIDYGWQLSANFIALHLLRGCPEIVEDDWAVERPVDVLAHR
jgi:hypothetical protein